MEYFLIKLRCQSEKMTSYYAAYTILLKVLLAIRLSVCLDWYKPF